jgi:hypothetical protein
MSKPDRATMPDRAHEALSVRRQCVLLGLARAPGIGTGRRGLDAIPSVFGKRSVGSRDASSRAWRRANTRTNKIRAGGIVVGAKVVLHGRCHEAKSRFSRPIRRAWPSVSEPNKPAASCAGGARSKERDRT